MVRDRWRRFYEERDYDRCAYLDGEAMVDHAVAFPASAGVLEAVLLRTRGAGRGSDDGSLVGADDTLDGTVVVER